MNSLVDDRVSLSVEVDGEKYFVSFYISPNSVEITLKNCSLQPTVSQLILGKPFREVIESARLKAIVQALVAHDFLIRKSLKTGREVRFQVSLKSFERTVKRDVISSARQIASLAIKPGDKVLPWFLEKPSTEALYKFQRVGVNWLLEAESRLLADDMGLGKTVQALFAVRLGFSELLFHNVLILCPKSLVLNWLEEFRKWAPELIALAIAPAEKECSEVWCQSLHYSHVVIANYEQIRAAGAVVSQRKFDVVIADEAHRLRNASSQISQGFRSLKRDRFWALTGTPIERDLRDLATLMSLLDEKRFSLSDATTASSALREKAKPYILRRTKNSVLKDLPKVVSTTEILSLLPDQAKTYRQVLSGYDCNGQRISNPLHKLGELRRVCDFDPVSKKSIKLERIYEQLLDVKASGEKAIVFSYVLEPLVALMELAGQSLNAVMLTGSLSGEEREEVVSRFKSEPGITALLASTRAASEGLTLVEANHVFFVNSWWNPSSNAQARDRVNRIGQTKNVFINEYVCNGTVEEAIQRLLKAKTTLVNEVIDRLDDALLKEQSLLDYLS